LEHGKQIIKVLIAANQLLFRRGLRALVAAEADLEVTGEAVNIAETLQRTRELSPDVLVLDLDLIQGCDQSSLMALRQAKGSAALLCLGDQDGPAKLELAINAGAQAYMFKNSIPSHLLAGIRQVSVEDQNAGIISRIVPDLQALAATSRVYARGPVLTAREQEVVRLLAEGRTVREVASELALSVKTIEAHKLNLMRKLDIHSRASLIEYAVRNGIVPVPATC